MTIDTDARRALGIGLAISVTYVVAARLGFQLAFVAEQVTTVWAPTGIAQAALLLWGRKFWPAIWIGAFVANATTAAPLWTAAFVATGNTLEAVAAAWILSQIVGFDPVLRRTRDAVAFIVAAACLAPALSATIGVATLCAAQVQPWGRFQELWTAWWLGDVLGALVVAPVILTTVRSIRTRTRREWAEAGVLLFGTAAVTHTVFGHVFGPTIGHHPLEYVIFPFLIAAAVRLGQPTTALVVLMASIVTVWNTIQGRGPFASPEIHQSLVLLQVFMGVLAGTGLLLAAAITERLTSERRRAAAHAVSEIVAEATTLSEAATAIVRAICENLGWPVGVLWRLDPDTQRVHCLTAWGSPAMLAAGFVEASQRASFVRGEGLPGRVWATGTATWLENVGVDRNFPRAPAARHAGLHGAFAFPICIGEEVVGVLEFFHQSVLTPDEDLLSAMSTVGNQLGQFAARKRVEASVLEEQRQSRIARAEAERANRAKDEFLATLSHELRTPLNAIVGWTRMLLDGTMDGRSTRRALEVIDRNAHMQVQLVADILDVSRIITGTLQMNVRPVDLGTVIGAAMDAVRPASDAKTIRILTRLDAPARLTEGDPQRLQQIVWNLLANAVKFTPVGGLVEVELVETGRNGVRMTVRDNGAGIDPSFLPHVFDRFRQADGSVSREHGGLGLGLAIVRHLVELHGGTVQAHSDGPGKGASFIVELPRTKADPTFAPEAGHARE